VLGPLMFIMFINDITEVCSNNEADIIYLFADDAKLCMHIAHESDYERLQTALSKLQDWSEIQCDVNVIGVHCPMQIIR